MKVNELKGYKSLRALNAFHALMLGLKMLPAYAGIQYEEFYQRIQEMEPSEQKKLIKEAALFVQLEKDEVEALISFCSDANGVPYTSENVKNLSPEQIHDAVVSVCVEMSKFKIDLISKDEKKN